jgi:hypothetical protein
MNQLLDYKGIALSKRVRHYCTVWPALRRALSANHYQHTIQAYLEAFLPLIDLGLPRVSQYAEVWGHTCMQAVDIPW